MEDIHIPKADTIQEIDRWSAYMWAEAGSRGLGHNQVYVTKKKGKSLIIFKK